MKIKRRIRNNGNLLLTPLIDMIFLVVIFFMINATMAMNPAIKIDLPEAYTAQSVLTKEVVVTIKPSGMVYIGNKPINMERYPAEIKRAVRKSKKDEILLQVDESVKYKYVLNVLDLSRLAGIKKVSMAAKKKSMIK